MHLNFNPLETNLVNLAIVIGVLFWFLRGFLGGILEVYGMTRKLLIKLVTNDTIT